MTNTKDAATDLAAAERDKCSKAKLNSTIDKLIKKLEDQSLGVKPYEIHLTGTDLYWARCPIGQSWSGSECEGQAKEVTWNDAVFACPKGYRLPTLVECGQVLGGCTMNVTHKDSIKCAPCRKSTSCTGMYGSGRKDNIYWSSARLDNQDQAWFVSFFLGTAFYSHKKETLQVL